VLNVKGEKLYTVTTRTAAPPSYGHTCRQGRFDSFDYLAKAERLKTPLVKKDGKLVEASWDEALERVATEFKRLQQDHGSSALAGIGSPRATNEANYLLQKILRTQLGSNNLDYPGGQAPQATLTALSRTVGTGAMSSSFGEIEQAEVILALGNDIEENNPVVATAMKRASRTLGQRLITVSSTEVALSEFAEPPLIVPKEDLLDFLQSLLKLLCELNLYDQDFVAANTKGVEELEKSLASLNYLDTVARLNLLPSTFEEIARSLANASSLALVYSEDIAADAQGVSKVGAIANLAMLTARIGQAHSGIYPLYRHINAQGAMDMGMTPGNLPESAGLDYRAVIDTAHQSKIKGLYLMGENPIATEPEREKIQEALKQVEFLVVQDIFLTQSGELADVVLPSTGFTEQEGTLTNTERRIQKLRAALPAPGRALPDWRILADLLNQFDPATSYNDAQAVYQEIMTVVPLYQGLTYERLVEGGMLASADLKKPLEFATG
jgi:predicted molibdopterin-dependent oxidoreductase YjgC